MLDWTRNCARSTWREVEEVKVEKVKVEEVVEVEEMEEVEKEVELEDVEGGLGGGEGGGCGGGGGGGGDAGGDGGGGGGHGGGGAYRLRRPRQRDGPLALRRLLLLRGDVHLQLCFSHMGQICLDGYSSDRCNFFVNFGP